MHGLSGSVEAGGTGGLGEEAGKAGVSKSELGRAQCWCSFDQTVRTGLVEELSSRTSVTLDSEISSAPEREAGRGPVSRKRLFILE